VHEEEHIDLNPVRAGLVRKPAYRGQYAHYVLAAGRWAVAHAPGWTLGNTRFRASGVCGARFSRVALEQQQEMTDAALGGWAMGDGRFFVEKLQKQTSRVSCKPKPGRPALVHKIS
jgi:hypothetical protein